MNLGLVVLHQRGDPERPLSDRHLRRVAAHTEAPYTSHGAALGLNGSRRRRLASAPRASHVLSLHLVGRLWSRAGCRNGWLG